MRNEPFLAACIAAICTAAAPAVAKADAIAVTGGERSVVRYVCDDGTERSVTYVNGTDQSLAIVPVEGAGRIFVNVLSGSGARYASGRFVWWTKGAEATLYDETRGADGKPLATCSEGAG